MLVLVNCLAVTAWLSSMPMQPASTVSTSRIFVARFLAPCSASFSPPRDFCRFRCGPNPQTSRRPMARREPAADRRGIHRAAFHSQRRQRHHQHPAHADVLVALLGKRHVEKDCSSPPTPIQSCMARSRRPARTHHHLLRVLGRTARLTGADGKAWSPARAHTEVVP